MSEIDWKALAEPFPDTEVKSRPGAATWDHKQSCEGRKCRETRDGSKHIQFSYIDARAVAQRLDDVVAPDGWQFTCEVAVSGVIKGRLEIGGRVREDFGYPNSDDDAEPYKSAVSDALKRCGVLFGIGRHLYDDNKAGHRPAPRPAPARIAPRPTVVPQEPPDLMDEPEYPDTAESWALPVADDTTCADHGIAWIGEYGDRYHKKSEGGYCRTAPGNVAKARR